MDFKDQIKQLGDRIGKLKDQIATEEATKNAFIMPFIQVLGYDIFNPTEVVPEFVADIGTKKGEKVDYAILKDSQPIILIECKHWAQKLDLHDNQLLRYFNTTKAKFGILTNGIKFRFYTDLVEPNIMDEKPFLEFDISEIKENQVEELKKFHKSYFDINNILSSASELKYTNELKTLINNELKTPSEDFIRFFAQKVYPKKITANVLFQFSELVKKSVQHLVTDMITERLKSAIGKENESVSITVTPNAASSNEPQSTTTENTAPEKDKNIETTGEELEGFYIVKSILRTTIASSRITYRDAQSYFAILFDDNNRKPICRLYFNGSKKFISTFDSSKKEIKNEIANLDAIYNFAEQLKATTEIYLGLSPEK